MHEEKQTSWSGGRSKRIMNFEDVDRDTGKFPWYFQHAAIHPNHTFVAPNRSFHARQRRSARSNTDRETRQQLSPPNGVGDLGHSPVYPCKAVPWRCGMHHDSRSTVSFEKICSSVGTGFDVVEAVGEKVPGKVWPG